MRKVTRFMGFLDERLDHVLVFFLASLLIAGVATVAFKDPATAAQRANSACQSHGGVKSAESYVVVCRDGVAFDV